MKVILSPSEYPLGLVIVGEVQMVQDLSRSRVFEIEDSGAEIEAYYLDSRREVICEADYDVEDWDEPADDAADEPDNGTTEPPADLASFESDPLDPLDDDDE